MWSAGEKPTAIEAAAPGSATSLTVAGLEPPLKVP